MRYILEEPLDRSNPRNVRRGFMWVTKELIMGLKDLLMSVVGMIAHSIAHTPNALA